ncbi:MAG: uroporphyrinogen-III C-methyltransferase, partial [Phycisphaeraceae bacterium]|nr:uroporphyrinogen-III C-methyltransferase [Phycisphaeraceae bacterium]
MRKEQDLLVKRGAKVYLVGAGPGDPGLITARGLEVLRRADVVVFDALANPRLLNEAPAGAKRIDVGKRSSAHTLTQDQTNQLLVDEAKGPGNPVVVRLKGGDPYLFGRGAEEAAYLFKHGVACEVIPGVTSGIAGPAAAGIPVTHREVASTVTLVTGHEDPTKEGSAIDYAALAGLIRAGGTVCFYMGMSRLEAIAGTLMGEGVGSDMPAAVVQWGTTPRQRSARGTLATIAGVVEREKLGSPAIVVVGRVAGLREVGLDAFTRRSLFGQRVIVTRTRHQASALSAMLLERGAEVLEAPTIEIEPLEGEMLKRVDERIGAMREYDWLVLTSIN